MNARTIKFTVMLVVACSAVGLIVKNITVLKREDIYPAPDFNALRVVVVPSKTQVRVGEKFELELRVENISQENQAVAAWTCSWEFGWQCSDKRIFSASPMSCNSNFPHSVIISSGEAYTNTFLAIVKDAAALGKISFRMGFGSFKDFLNSKDQVRAEYYQPIWSEPVTIEVIP
jgi:hypothetical protein